MTTPDPTTGPLTTPPESGSQVVPKVVPNDPQGIRAESGSRCSRISDREPLSEPSPSGSRNHSNSHPLYADGTVWLTTPRTTPAWIAALDLLDDEQWHPIPDVTRAMHAAADLAPRTIATHLNSASARGWITKRRGRIRLRNRHAIEHAISITADISQPMDVNSGGRPHG